MPQEVLWDFIVESRLRYLGVYLYNDFRVLLGHRITIGILFNHLQLPSYIGEFEEEKEKLYS